MIEDFYPTPPNLIAKMLDGVKLTQIKTILDIGAGRGDIPDFIINSEFVRVDYWNDQTFTSKKKFEKDSFNIDVIEINPDLQKILTAKEYRLIHDDYLTFHTYRQYDLIIGNLPFSIGAECLQKALQMIEETGGNLRLLVNAETIKNPHTATRQWCINKIKDLSGEIEFLTDEFVEAERKTKVEVALIKIEIEIETENNSSLILDDLQKAANLSFDDSAPSEMVEVDVFKQMVSGFNMECKAGVKMIQEYHALKPYILDRIVKAGQTDYSKPMLELQVEGVSYKNTLTEQVNFYLRKVRAKYWEILFDNLSSCGKYTSNVLKILSAKLKDLENYDFTIFNIHQVEKELDAKINEGIHDAILKMFTEFCNYNYRNGDNGEPCGDNVHYYNGWKTNKAHKINHKIILPINGVAAKWGSWDKDRKKLNDHYIREKMVDMVKVFQTLEAENQTNAWRLVGDQIHIADEMRKDYNLYLRYFDIRFFKKGTCHIWFRKQELLDKLNIYGSQRKNWLPPSYGKVSYNEMDSEEKAVIDEFQGKEAYEKVFNNQAFYLVQNTETLQLTAGM